MLLSQPRNDTTNKGMEELLPGVEFACEASYILTQADVDAAEVMNTASVSGVAGDVESTEVRLQYIAPKS